MALITKLVNPTPFEVKIPYEKGIYIVIPPDGDIDLSMQQLDDFRPGKPGSEETRKLLTFEGVFLQDSDLSYDYQALQTLRACVKDRMERVNTFIERNKTARLPQGAAIDDKTMEEIKESAGYARMERNADKLVARIKALEKVVNADENEGAVRQNLDPERTCFVINPPRQFPSKTALAMFLAENPDIAEKHEALVNPTVQDAETGTKSPSATPSDELGRALAERTQGFGALGNDGEYNG